MRRDRKGHYWYHDGGDAICSLCGLMKRVSPKSGPRGGVRYEYETVNGKVSEVAPKCCGGGG